MHLLKKRQNTLKLIKLGRHAEKSSETFGTKKIRNNNIFFLPTYLNGNILSAFTESPLNDLIPCLPAEDNRLFE